MPSCAEVSSLPKEDWCLSAQSASLLRFVGAPMVLRVLYMPPMVLRVLYVHRGIP